MWAGSYTVPLSPSGESSNLECEIGLMLPECLLGSLGVHNRAAETTWACKEGKL